MGDILFANNVNMQLSGNLAADDTDFSVITGQGSQCPEIATDSTDYMLLVFTDKDGNREIVKIIEHEADSDTFTIGDDTSVPHAASTDGRAYEATFDGYQTALAITASDSHSITMPVTGATLQAMLAFVGVTASVAEINAALDGITATAAEINTGCDGIANPPLAGDDTAGRVLRMGQLRISDGTNASTIKCQLISKWNGDAIAETDNIPKSGSSGYFTLDVTGSLLTISSSGLSGNCLAAQGSVSVNVGSLTGLVAGVSPAVNNINIQFSTDITAIGGAEHVYVDVLYITDA